MINVRISINRKEREYSLSVKGHAGFSQRGKDIVCAASSVLAYTIGQVVKNMHESNMLVDAPTLDFADGNATVSCKVTKDHDQALWHNFYTIITGYKLLGHNYPRYVEFTYDVEPIEA